MVHCSSESSSRRSTYYDSVRQLRWDSMRLTDINKNSNFYLYYLRLDTETMSAHETSSSAMSIISFILTSLWSVGCVVWSVRIWFGPRDMTTWISCVIGTDVQCTVNQVSLQFLTVNVFLCNMKHFNFRVPYSSNNLVHSTAVVARPLPLSTWPRHTERFVVPPGPSTTPLPSEAGSKEISP